MGHKKHGATSWGLTSKTEVLCFFKEKSHNFKAFKSFQLLPKKKQGKDAACSHGSFGARAVWNQTWHAMRTLLPSITISEKGLLMWALPCLSVLLGKEPFTSLSSPWQVFVQLCREFLMLSRADWSVVWSRWWHSSPIGAEKPVSQHHWLCFPLKSLRGVRPHFLICKGQRRHLIIPAMELWPSWLSAPLSGSLSEKIPSTDLACGSSLPCLGAGGLLEPLGSVFTSALAGVPHGAISDSSYSKTQVMWLWLKPFGSFPLIKGQSLPLFQALFNHSSSSLPCIPGSLNYATYTNTLYSRLTSLCYRLTCNPPFTNGVPAKYFFERMELVANITWSFLI